MKANEYQFTCLSCGCLFTHVWQQDLDLVKCPCGALHETENDYDFGGDHFTGGPRTTRLVVGSAVQRVV